jgi:C-terminal processing protease CtpA/Prc
MRDYYPMLNITNQITYELFADSVGYIQMNKVNKANVKEISAWINRCKALIIDMRGYPLDNAFLFMTKEKFIPNNTVFALFTYPVKNMSGQFQLLRERTDKYGGEKYSGTIVALVNETTQSYAETLTMLLQTNQNVTVIGSQTAGADGDMALISLPGGIKMAFSSLGMYYPDGREIQRIGISIDKEIKQTIKGLIDGKDELKEYALSIISNEEALTSDSSERSNN